MNIYFIEKMDDELENNEFDDLTIIFYLEKAHY